MSLDVHLISTKKVNKKKGSGIFIRENGATREISEAEWYRRYPGKEPVRFTGKGESTKEVYWGNITHNLGRMAQEADIYYALWRPEEKGFKYAKDIIPTLELGLEMMKADPERFKQFDSDNGWGTYDQFLPFIMEYLEACKENRDALIEVSR